MLIASRGSTRCCIMMSHPAHETVKLAADELQKWIYKATGASMPVLTELTPWEGPRILVGDSKPLQAMGVSLEDYDLGEEGYILSCRGDTLIVAGATPLCISGRARGTALVLQRCDPYSFRSCP